MNSYIPDGALYDILSRLTATDRDIADILLDSGFRLDDVMHLRVYQIRSPFLTLIERKTGHIRTVKLTDDLHCRLVEKNVNKHSFSYVFSSLRRGKGCRAKEHRTTFWRHFRQACKNAGYDRDDYNPHSLRKVYAVRLYKRTGSLEAVRVNLGHTNIAVTMLYALSDVVDPHNNATDFRLLR